MFSVIAFLASFVVFSDVVGDRYNEKVDQCHVYVWYEVVGNDKRIGASTSKGSYSAWSIFILEDSHTKFYPDICWSLNREDVKRIFKEVWESRNRKRERLKKRRGVKVL